ncbi:MAG: DUF2341 domain-containing protein [Methanosarcina sp.]
MKRLFLLCGIVSLFFIVLFTGCTYAAANDTQDPSTKDDPWNYVQDIVIKENSGKNLIDYPVCIVLDSSNFDFSKIKNDGSDIRFFSGKKNLDYWIENWDFKNKEASIWVKIPSIPADEEIKISMKYGNPDARDESNGKDTFDFFDDFDGTRLNEINWSIKKAGGGEVEVEDGICKILAPQVHAYDSSMIYSKADFEINSMFVVKRLKATTGKDERGPVLGQGFKDQVDTSKNEIKHETEREGETRVSWETISRNDRDRAPGILNDGISEGEWYTSGIAWFENNGKRQVTWFKNGVIDPKMDFSPSSSIPDSPMHVYLSAASNPSSENTGYMAVNYAFVRKFTENEPAVTFDSFMQTRSGLSNPEKDISENSSKEVPDKEASEVETDQEPESENETSPASEAESLNSEPQEALPVQENPGKEQATSSNVNSNNTSYPDYIVDTSGIRLSSPYQYDFNALVKELDSSNLDTIFLTVSGKDVWQYERFVKMAHEDGISVHAIILEDANCTEQENLNFCEETLNTVINYNKKSLAPFDGIEIYVQFSGSESPEDYSDYKLLFETAEKNLAENVSISANIPYDNGASLVEEIAPFVDFFVVRAYDTGTEDKQLNSVPNIVDAIAPQMGEIRGAGSQGIIEVSVKEGFEDRFSIQELFASLTDYYSNDSAFLGVSIFNYENYTGMPVKIQAGEDETQLPGFNIMSVIVAVLGISTLLKVRMKRKT